MTKVPTPTEQSKKQRDNTKNASKNFDYTTIADQIWTVRWSDNNHPLVLLNRITSTQPSHQPQQPCNEKYIHLNIYNFISYITLWSVNHTL